MALSEKWNFLFQHSKETFTATDFAGNERTFKLSCSEQEHIGYTIYAVEDNESINRYEFKAHSYISPWEAYIKLITKIRRELAMRHLVKTDDRYSLLCNSARGRIVDGGVVIDGQFLTWEELTIEIESCEGCEFELNIKYGCD